MKTKLFSTLILLSILLAACGGTPTPAPSVAPVASTNSIVVAEGTLLPDPSVELSFAQPGIVAEVLVSTGGQVTEGQVIARLENSEALQAEVARAEEAYLLAEQAFGMSEAAALKNLAEAHEALRQAQQAFDNFDIPSDLRGMTTRETLEYTHARLEEARVIYEPYKNYKADKEPARTYKKQLDDAWADYRKAIQWAELEANLEVARANARALQKEFDNLTVGENAEQTAIARARFESALANLNAARAALANSQLRAPFTATVLSLDLSVGETVYAGIPVAFLGDVTHWQVETKDLAEIDVAKVAIGDKVIVKLDAFPDEEFTGRVVEIDPVGREYLGDMTYKTTTALDESDPRFLWNMTATVTIDVE
ncbi:MAG: HlyD family secretion protein [Chloroflexota bacterium]